MTDRSELQRQVALLQSQERDLELILDSTRWALHRLNMHLCPSRADRIAQLKREEKHKCRRVQESNSTKGKKASSSKRAHSKQRGSL